MTLHFLHIGKTGGTAIKYALRTAGWACWASEYKKKSAEMPETRYGHLILHRHFFGLQELEPEDYLFFSLRDPISRFVSGFYSRQRKGMPRRFREWNEVERTTFERFSTPQELALALASADRSERGAAERAMRSVRHLGHVSKFLGSEADLRATLSRVVYIIRQETLDADWRQLRAVLGLPENIELPTNPMEAHRGNHPTPALDNRALAILRDWYADDYRLLDLCETIRADHGWGVAGTEPRIHVPPPGPAERRSAPPEVSLPSGEVGRIAKTTPDPLVFWTRFLRRIDCRTAAAVGASREVFGRQVLDACPTLETFYMVDSSEHLDGRNAPAERAAALSHNVAEATAATPGHEANHVVLRARRSEMADIPSGGLDFAYVDADHTLCGMAIDLVRIYPKVREGGWIGGDGFAAPTSRPGQRVERTLISAFAVYFAEAVSAWIYALPHHQFLVRKRSGGSFKFVDVTRRHGSSDLLREVAPSRDPRRSSANLRHRAGRRLRRFLNA